MDEFNSLQLNRRALVQAGAGVVLGAMASRQQAWAQALPAVQVDSWLDAARSREVPVLLRWPQGRALGVVLHSHGLGGKKEGGDVWGQAWAQAGFLVVHAQHPGSDAASLKGGFAALREASKPQQLVARMQDVRFVVAQMQRRRAAGANENGGDWGSVPLEKLAITGHSFGARTTLLSAGWTRSGISVAGGTEPLAKAFIAFSPALGQNPSPETARQELARITRPMLICTGSLDGEVLGNGETPQSRRAVFDALPEGKKALLWLDQADHFSFAGHAKQIPSTMLARRTAETLDKEAAHHALISRISTAWLQEQLLGRVMPAQVERGAQDEWIRG